MKLTPKNNLPARVAFRGLVKEFSEILDVDLQFTPKALNVDKRGVGNSRKVLIQAPKAD